MCCVHLSRLLQNWITKRQNHTRCNGFFQRMEFQVQKYFYVLHLLSEAVFLLKFIFQFISCCVLLSSYLHFYVFSFVQVSSLALSLSVLAHVSSAIVCFHIAAAICWYPFTDKGQMLLDYNKNIWYRISLPNTAAFCVAFVTILEILSSTGPKFWTNSANNRFGRTGLNYDQSLC